jgi:hypothetical protein
MRMPLEGELATLGEAAAVALVTAMGTSGWTGIRDAVGRLFNRAGRDEIGGRLDGDASLVSAAADQAETRAAVQPFWRLAFMEVLSTDPDSAADLAEIIRARAESGRTTGTTRMEQHTTVRDSGRAFVAQAGNVFVYGEGTFSGSPLPPHSGPRRHQGHQDDGE